VQAKDASIFAETFFVQAKDASIFTDTFFVLVLVCLHEKFYTFFVQQAKDAYDDVIQNKNKSFYQK
jgi:hypothetical protein